MRLLMDLLDLDFSAAGMNPSLWNSCYFYILILLFI